VFFESPGRDRKTAGVTGWKDCVALGITIHTPLAFEYI